MTWRQVLPSWISPRGGSPEPREDTLDEAAAELRQLTRDYLATRPDSWLGDEVLTNVLPARAARIVRDLAVDPAEDLATRLEEALRLAGSASTPGGTAHADEVRLALVRWLGNEGRLSAALALLRPALGRNGPQALRQEAGRLKRRLALVSRHARDALKEKDVVTAAFGHALQLACARSAPTPGRAIGPIVMLTNTLGAGGAERQVVNTALGLQNVIASRESIGRRRLLGPVHVLWGAPGKRKDDFFAGLLARNGVKVTELTREAPLPRVHDDVGALADVFPTIPREGLRSIYPALRKTVPDVVHLWQDGMILRGAAPALLSGASRVVIGFRTVPPTRRPERMSAAYERACRTLLLCPRVRAVTNSRVVAQLYGEWLDLDPALFNVIPNGVEPLASAPDAESTRRWAVFEAATRNARFTLGAVMRLDENKRPLTWIETAAALAARRPDTRFVVVGDGPLRDTMEELALRRGIGGRTLFVGRSDRVGFWLDKMDALMLLSREEGLPNALIEAQMAGVPVVTMPAGGSAETLDPDRTGILLEASDLIEPHTLAEMIAQRLVDEPERRAAMGGFAREWARERFSIRSMIEKTVRLYG